MKNFLYIIIISLTFLGSSASAIDVVVPKQTITGAEEVIEPGEVVFLSLSKIESPPPFLTKSSVDWRVFDNGKEKKFRKNSDGSIFFGSGITKRKISVLASVSYLYVIKDETGKFLDADVRTVLLAVTVNIGGANPNPPDPPDPQPDPDPVFPDGKYKYAAKVYQIAKNHVKNKAGAKILANAFTTTASSIAAGAYTSVEDILKATTEANRSALNSANIDKTQWDEFFTKLQEVIYTDYISGKLVAVPDYAIAWREIAAGLEKVK